MGLADRPSGLPRRGSSPLRRALPRTRRWSKTHNRPGLPDTSARFPSGRGKIQWLRTGAPYSLRSGSVPAGAAILLPTRPAESPSSLPRRAFFPAIPSVSTVPARPRWFRRLWGIRSPRPSEKHPPDQSAADPAVRAGNRRSARLSGLFPTPARKHRSSACPDSAAGTTGCHPAISAETRPGPSARERAWCSFPASGRPPPQSGRRSPRRRRHGWSGRAPARPPAEKPAPFPHRKARRSGTFCHAPRRRCSLPFLFGDGSLSAPPFPDKAVFSLSSLPFFDTSRGWVLGSLYQPAADCETPNPTEKFRKMRQVGKRQALRRPYDLRRA